MESNKLERLSTVTVNGHPFPPFKNMEKHARAIFAMKPRKDDIFICTYPKCGTTWIQYIIWEILHDGVPPPNANEMMVRDFPFLEFIGPAVAESQPSPRTLKVHLPYRLTPVVPEAKYVSVMRNVYDCCVSFFHQLSEFHTEFTGKQYLFDTFLDDFLMGVTPFGDYRHLVQSWYERRDEPNVLFLSYEAMKADHQKGTMEIARFLGDQCEKRLQTDPDLLRRVLLHSSFEYMKQNAPFRVARDIAAREAIGGTFTATDPDPKILGDDNLFRVSKFYRKGEVGGGVTDLTVEQRVRLDQFIEDGVQDANLRKMMRKTRI